MAPLKPKEKSVDEILQTLTEHFDPKPSVIVQRFRFNSRLHQEGESVAKFMAELQQLSEHCEFGAMLNDMLRDRLVVGIMNNRIQRRLLAEKELTFKRAYELAIAHETAEKNTAKLKQKEAMSTPGNPEGKSVHQLQKQPVHPLERQQVPKAGNRPIDKISGCCYRCDRDTNSSSAGSRMSNVLVAAKLGMRRLFVAQ